jgi:hypothetical protein
MLYREIIAVCFEINTEVTDAVYKHKTGLLMLNVVVHKVTTGL